MQLLVLKMLYILFNTKGLSEYFYTNDLCVLVDVFLREIVDLDEESESVCLVFDTYQASNNNISSGTRTFVCCIPFSPKPNYALCLINDPKLFVHSNPWWKIPRFVKSARRQNVLSNDVSAESGVYSIVRPATSRGSLQSLDWSAPQAPVVIMSLLSHSPRSF
jgi:hypothetical protein